MKNSVGLIFVLCLSLFAESSIAAIYREVSPSGQVTFTDRSSSAYKPSTSSNNKTGTWTPIHKRNRKNYQASELHNLTADFNKAILTKWLSRQASCGNHFQRIDFTYNNVLRFFSRTDRGMLVLPIKNTIGNQVETLYSETMQFQYDTKLNVILRTRNATKKQHITEVMYVCNKQDIPQLYQDRYDTYLINQQFLAGHGAGKNIEIKDGGKFLAQECRRSYTQKDYKTARSTCGLAATNKRNVVSMFYSGMLYRYNWGGNINYTQSYKYTKQAADAGFSPAFKWMAWHFRFGKSVTKNLSKATQWYIRAVDAGHLESAKSVGDAYIHGYGVEKNYAQAAVWYLIAANAGDAHAQNRIGAMYANGTGLKQDFKRAHKWILKAYNQNNTKAIFNLAILYEHDKIVNNGTGYATPLFKKAQLRGINKSSDIKNKFDRVLPEFF